MKKEKNKNVKDKEKNKYNSVIKEKFQGKNPTEKLEMNLSYPIKINTKYHKKKLNNIESTISEKKISTSPKQPNVFRDKLFLNNFTISKKTNNIKNYKNSFNNKNNSSSENLNNIKKEEKNGNKSNKDNKDNSIEDNNDFYTKKKKQLQNKIKQSSIPNKTSKNYITSNNLNQIYTSAQYNNDLFSNLFIDSSSDNKNILVSELDIELSNMDQSTCNKKNDKIDNQNMNIIEDEEDTNQKSNEHINVYKKIELRFKSKLEKSLNKYFKKNGTNFYIGNSNSNQFPKEIENQNKSKSIKNGQNDGIENKKNIKKLINSDGKMSHNVNFTIDLRENNKNKRINNMNDSKLKLIKKKLKENETIKKFQKIISYKTTKLKINNNSKKKHIITNSNLVNKKYNSKKKVNNKINKDNSTKNRIIIKKENSPLKTKTIACEKKINAIYSKIMNDTNLINENKHKTTEKETNKNRLKNNSTGIRLSYKNSPYYLHSINSIKSKNVNNNNIKKYDPNNFKYNQLYHHKLKNNIFKGEVSITSSYNNTKRKNVEDININNLNKHNISYLNSKSVKNNNKLSKFFSFANEDKSAGTQRSKYNINKNIDFQNKRNDFNKKIFKSYNCKMRTKPLNYYKALNTEIKNFKTIKYFNVNKVINKKIELSNRKVYKNNNKDELIKKRNMKNKVKSDLCNEDNSESSAFFYNKVLFLCYSPYKSSKIIQHNSFKKKLENNL